MLVKDLQGDWENSLIRQHALWNRDIRKLRALDLTMFLRQHWGTENYYQAQRQIEALIDQSWFATLHRKLPEAPPITYFDPTQRQRITVDELCSWLGETSLVRRRAIIFALETGMPIQTIIGLTWKQLYKLHDLPQYALTIAGLMPRHLRLDYVFWEPMNGMIAAPLFGLGETMLEVSQGLGFDAFRRLYVTTIPVDCKSDLELFMHEFNENLNEQISK